MRSSGVGRIARLGCNHVTRSTRTDGYRWIAATALRCRVDSWTRSRNYSNLQLGSVPQFLLSGSVPRISSSTRQPSLPLTVTEIHPYLKESIMNVDELPDESDSSDEDYDPGKQEDVPSEVDSDGEPEDILSGSEETIENGTSKTRRKKNKKQNRVKSNKRRNEETGSDELNQKNETVEEQKQNIDDIWADFMKDTGFKSKKDTKPTELETTKSHKLDEPKGVSQKSVDEINSKPSEKVKITQLFEFAGEEVKVVKEVAADSAEARLLATPDEIPRSSKGKRNVGLSGIGNVLSQLSKKPKISTLEKTKLDWDNFKKENNIEEDLQTHNKGKDGYLERQDFLQRADLRRFEIEKNIRSIERSKRFNSTL